MECGLPSLFGYYSCIDVLTTESTMDKKTSSIKMQYAMGRLMNVQAKHHIFLHLHLNQRNWMQALVYYVGY